MERALRMGAHLVRTLNWTSWGRMQQRVGMALFPGGESPQLDGSVFGLRLRGQVPRTWPERVS